MPSYFNRIAACAALLLFTAAANAGEKKLMHCFAFSSVKEATPADWDAFFKASDAMPSRIKGVSRVWYGKLANPLTQYEVAADAETRKKMVAGETVKADVKRITRDWGMCVEMADAAALKAYDADPFHKEWVAAYEKVRVYGTTTYNILGQ